MSKKALLENIYLNWLILWFQISYETFQSKIMHNIWGSCLIWLSLSHSVTYLCTPAGLEGMECSLPTDGRQISLNLLSEESFRECRGVLSLKDYLIVIFSGICISVAAIIASFILASIIHCFQRLKAKRTDEEEGDEWASAMLQRLDRFTNTAPQLGWRTERHVSM